MKNALQRAAVVLGAALATTALQGQSLTGTTGLVTIPTAEMPKDGAVAVGLHLVASRYNGYNVPPLREHPALVQFVSVGFLPFVEVGLRLTRGLDVPRQALGDRSVSVRVRLREEGRHTPAVVAGVHDVLGTRIFHAEYLAASKQLDGVPHLGRVGLHLGYGGDWLSLSARRRQFMGVFGGVSVAPRPWAAVLVEHDSDHVNAAVRLRLRRVTLLGALHGVDALSGGVSYAHPLR